MDNFLILSFYDKELGVEQDIEVAADLTASELLTALNSGFGLGLALDELQNCYIKSENPIALLRGSRTLREYGIRTGSRIRCRD